MTDKKKIKINFCDWYRGFNPESNKEINILKKVYDVEISDSPDFLFCLCFGAKHLEYKNCVKIFTTGENVIPDFNEYDYGSAFDYIDFGDRYFRKLLAIPNKIICDRSGVTDDFCNRRFCNFIYSNATSGEGVFLRQEFCKKLMEYKEVDCPGKILHNMDAGDELAPRDGDWWRSKSEFLKKYKFTIAFENSRSNGYTTEKLVQPLQSFSIPIYWGNPLVARDFNPKAFINCNDYDNDFDAVIERVKEIDNDPDKYLAMLRENPMQPDFDFAMDKKYEKWILDIVAKGNKPFNKDPHRHSALGEYQKQIKRQMNSIDTDKSLLQKQQNAKSQTIMSEPEINPQSEGAMVKTFTKTKGNWLYKQVETEHYVKTYICGICTRKRLANICY